MTRILVSRNRSFSGRNQARGRHNRCYGPDLGITGMSRFPGGIQLAGRTLDVMDLILVSEERLGFCMSFNSRATYKMSRILIPDRWNICTSRN